MTTTALGTAADGDTQSNAFQFQVADGARAVSGSAACKGLTLSATARTRTTRSWDLAATPHSPS
ncbi:hypothetical protein ABZ848_49335 [Streptomyces sp. NPDC047081]|uniref:hypothetical protein n=1 Tax=Streptomyces sp. NPDC047081 TaxID=3154706 RepID=UPI0033E2B894